MSRIVATVEARMTSKRLPGKVLLPAAGQPFLGCLIERLKRVPSVDAIVVATTVNASDQPIEDLCRKMQVSCFRGSEDDVLERVIGAAASQNAETVVEITADCPLIDPGLIEQVIRMFRHNPCDYASNVQVRSYPDGMDVQVFSLEVLRRSAALVQSGVEREHVTLHIRQHPDLFRQLHLVAPPEEYWPELGLTLDEPSDYQLLKKIAEHFPDSNFTLREILALLRARPEWVNLNAHVVRKGDT